MGHSLGRISLVIALSGSLPLQAVQTNPSVEEQWMREGTLLRARARPFQREPKAANYSVKDMHELLWYSVRQNPHGVELIRTHKLVLLPPQEGLIIEVPEEVWPNTIIFPTLIARQWFAARVEFHQENGRWVEALTLYETTGHLSRAMKWQLRRHQFRLQHLMIDPDKAASGPIIAQFILQLLGVAKRFDTVTNMRWQHLRFLQRRRELMTTRKDVRVLERNQTEVQAAEEDILMTQLVSTVVMPAKAGI